MALTEHQRHHVQALLADAPDMKTESERTRVTKEANDLLNATAPWPDAKLRAGEIHDWIEQPETRTLTQSELAKRR